jgi:hypothetical protein
MHKKWAANAAHFYHTIVLSLMTGLLRLINDVSAAVVSPCSFVMAT